MQFGNFAETLLGSTVKVKLLRHFLSEQAIGSEREIAKRIRVSHGSVNGTLQEFSEMNLIKCIRAGNVKIWQLNKESYAYSKLNALGTALDAEPLKDLLNFIRSTLEPHDLVMQVVLFGSIAHSREAPDSDIDLYILILNKGTRRKIQPDLDKLNYECLKKYGNNLSTHILTPSDRENPKNEKFLENIAKGIVIINRLGGKK